MKVEVAVLGFGLCGRKATLNLNMMFRAQELCNKSRWPSWDPLSNIPYGLCGRKATLNLDIMFRTQELCQSGGGVLGSPP